MASIEPEGDILFIKSAEVLSVRERMHSPKRFVYEVQVEWSNSTSTTCYRGYTEFFDFQCELIGTFPYEGGMVKGVERTIPYLPGRKIFQRRTAALAQKRLPHINDYVKKLVAMPERISQSVHVLKFFRSNWQEDRLRHGSFSLPRQSSSSALMFHQEGAVEYHISKLNENDVIVGFPVSDDQECSTIKEEGGDEEQQHGEREGEVEKEGEDSSVHTAAQSEIENGTIM